MFQNYDWIGDFILKNSEAQTKNGFLYFIKNDKIILKLFQDSCYKYLFPEPIILFDSATRKEEFYIHNLGIQNLKDSKINEIFNLHISNKLKNLKFDESFEEMNNLDKLLTERFNNDLDNKTGIKVDDSFKELIYFYPIQNIPIYRMNSLR